MLQWLIFMVYCICFSSVVIIHGSKAIHASETSIRTDTIRMVSDTCFLKNTTKMTSTGESPHLCKVTLRGECRYPMEKYLLEQLTGISKFLPLMQCMHRLIPEYTRIHGNEADRRWCGPYTNIKVTVSRVNITCVIINITERTRHAHDGDLFTPAINVDVESKLENKTINATTTYACTKKYKHLAIISIIIGVVVVLIILIALSVIFIFRRANNPNNEFTDLQESTNTREPHTGHGNNFQFCSKALVVRRINESWADLYKSVTETDKCTTVNGEVGTDTHATVNGDVGNYQSTTNNENCRNGDVTTYESMGGHETEDIYSDVRVHSEIHDNLESNCPKNNLHNPSFNAAAYAVTPLNVFDNMGYDNDRDNHNDGDNDYEVSIENGYVTSSSRCVGNATQIVPRFDEKNNAIRPVKNPVIYMPSYDEGYVISPAQGKANDGEYITLYDNEGYIISPQHCEKPVSKHTEEYDEGYVISPEQIKEPDKECMPLYEEGYVISPHQREETDSEYISMYGEGYSINPQESERTVPEEDEGYVISPENVKEIDTEDMPIYEDGYVINQEQADRTESEYMSMYGAGYEISSQQGQETESEYMPMHGAGYEISSREVAECDVGYMGLNKFQENVYE